jgi:hypothetical protein
MLRHALAIAIALSFATAAEATWIPRLSENYVTVHEGATVTVSVRAQWSGLTDYGFAPWTFFSDNESVAVVTGRLDAPGKNAPVEIRGVGVGVANIKARYDNGEVTHWAVGTVVVLRDPVAAQVHVAVSPLTIRAGQPVTFTAIFPHGDATFLWYWGELGEIRSPLGTGREVSITPPQNGRYKFWVAAVTPNSLAMRAFTVDVPSTSAPRRRAVRH